MTDISVNNNEPAAAQAPAMNLQDLVYLVNIVDVASRRGAFRAEELSAVGAVYDKVVSFLKSTGAIQEPAAKEEDAAAPEENAKPKRSKK